MATIKNTKITEIPIEATTTKEEDTTTKEETTTISKAQFNQLQESYRLKCIEYDKLLNAYRSLALRYTKDGESAKQFIKAALLGINLIFPEDNKGEN